MCGSTILRSVVEETRPKAHVRFLVPKEVYSGDMVLCYVSACGELHHFYSFRGEHSECTVVGDAFVLFKGVTAAELKRKQTNKRGHRQLHNSAQVLCSFRVASEGYTEVAVQAEDGVKLCKLPPPDDEFRVIVRGPPGPGSDMLPPLDQDWVLEYVFSCPPLPRDDTSWCLGAGKYDSFFHTFYVWGDVDFDFYGPSGFAAGKVPSAVTQCMMNQIVPQVMTGRCLAFNDPLTYDPGWQEFDTWVMQAQYYWQTEAGEDHGSKAMCGEAIHVEPGDEVTTRIVYHASEGAIEVTIGNGKKESRVDLPRPFPHSDAWQSWRQFFQACAEVDPLVPKNDRCRARPGLDVEYKGTVDVGVLNSVLPFTVSKISFPGGGGGRCGEVGAEDWPIELFSPRTGEGHEIDCARGTGRVVYLQDCTLGCGPPIVRLKKSDVEANDGMIDDHDARKLFDYYDDNGDGVLELVEFTTFLTSVFESLSKTDAFLECGGVSPEQMAQATAKQCFDEADSDHNGTLTFNEFQEWFTHDPSQRAFALLEDGDGMLPVSEARKLFDSYDVNGDGVLDLAEFTVYLTSMFEALSHTEDFVAQGVSPADMAEAVATDFFEEANMDGSGELSFTEFQAWFQDGHDIAPATVSL